MCMPTCSSCLAGSIPPTARLCCASHPSLLLWLQLQALDVYADLLPFLAVRGFAFMRSQQILELYFALPKDEREKSPRAAELVVEYNEWQLVLCENPSKKRQASSGAALWYRGPGLWMSLNVTSKPILAPEHCRHTLHPALQGRALRIRQH